MSEYSSGVVYCRYSYGMDAAFPYTPWDFFLTKRFPAFAFEHGDWRAKELAFGNTCCLLTHMHNYSVCGKDRPWER